MDNEHDDYESVVVTGSSVEDAVKRALLQLNVSLDAVDVEVLDAGSRGVLGLGGGDARVRVRLRTRSVDEDDDVNNSVEQIDSRRDTGGTAGDDVRSGEFEDDDELSEDSVSENEEDVTTAPIATGLPPSGVEAGDASRGPGERLDSGEDLEREAEAVLESLLDRMGFVADFDLVTEDPLSYNVVGDDDFERLIGHDGETLRSFDYLVNLILARRLGQPCRVKVDVDGYRQHRTEQLRELATTLADEVRESKEPVTLEAMPANERWLVHDVLTDDPDVRTYSIGDGHERRVVIAPKA